MPKMILLNDTFNGHQISAHRTVKAAVKAKLAHLKAVKKANGSNSYLTYSITDSAGAKIEQYDIEMAEHEIENGR